MQATIHYMELMENSDEIPRLVLKSKMIYHCNIVLLVARSGVKRCCDRLLFSVVFFFFFFFSFRNINENTLFLNSSNVKCQSSCSPSHTNYMWGGTNFDRCVVSIVTVAQQ